MLLALTPAQALLGGVSLGLLSVGRLLVHGKIFGVSGNARGLLKGGMDSSRLAVVLGLMAGGLVLRLAAPGCFGAIPDTFSVGRALTAGALVGTGSALANGCTSGHGIAGNARLSPRSMAFTLTIMGSGALSARLTGTAAALGVDGVDSSLSLPSLAELFIGLALVGSTAVMLRAAASLLRPPQPQQKGEHSAQEGLFDGLEGGLFALALGYAGMTDPRKVAGFLSPSAAGWDFSLAFVMGGAVLTAMPSFLATFRGGKGAKTAVVGRLPPRLGGRVDARLLAGGLLFGAGWGAGGLCPGPGIVGLATLAPQVLAFDAAMLAAMYLVP